VILGRIQAVKQRTLRILSAEDVRRALPMREALEVMKDAFRRLSQGDAVVPPRTGVEVASRRGSALFMPAYLPAEDRMAVKVVTLFEENAALGLPRIQALVLLVDAGNGSPLAVMDGASLTAIRTGAASGVATELLARSDASVAAVFGAGVQGRTQLEALLCVRPIREVLDGRKQGRTSLDEVTLFKSVGVAIQDLAAAARVFRLAREQGLGSEVAM